MFPTILLESEERGTPAVSTNQHDCTRHVADDVLDSLNLKVNNNLRDYVVLIVDINDGQYLSGRLSEIIIPDAIKLFNDAESSLSFVNSLYETDVFVIISGRKGQKVAHQFDVRSEIIGLYVYCMNENEHAIWANAIKKVRCVVSNPEELFIRLQRDIKEISSRWPVGQKSFQKASTSAAE